MASPWIASGLAMSAKTFLILSIAGLNKVVARTKQQRLNGRFDEYKSLA
jgi:hypothetical protein